MAGPANDGPGPRLMCGDGRSGGWGGGGRGERGEGKGAFSVVDKQAGDNYDRLTTLTRQSTRLTQPEPRH